MKSISAVVVTWNSIQDIELCLDSLLKQTCPLSDIIVVDNASTDGTPALIEEKYPKVKLLPQNKNYGFAKANNIGIAHSNSEWILTLNPDAYLHEEWLERLMSFSQQHPDADMLGGKLLSTLKDGFNIVDSLGIDIYTSRRVVDRGFRYLDVGRFNKVERIFGVCAAAALYRRKMLEDIKIDGEIFPEHFFAYYEDADVAWRAWRRGWKAYFVPDALGWHKRGGSPTGSRFSRELTHRNRIWLIARNEPLGATLRGGISLFWHEILMLLRTMRYPYLVKQCIGSLRGWLFAVRDRTKLETTNPEPPPFKRGVGFW